MRGTGTQGKPETDEGKIKECEAAGIAKAEQRKQQRRDQKCGKKSNVKISVGGNVEMAEIRVQAQQLGAIAYEVEPTTTQICNRAAKTEPSLSPIERDNWPKQNTTKPRVCLSMILKNEGAVLRRCLESVKGHVDEIVVVDTGSTDDTISIAKEFGAKVYEHPWQDSFSEARNWAIYHTDCEWLLQLDGDEELDKDAGPKIREAVRSAHDSTINLIHMVLINVDKSRDASQQEQSVVNSGKLMRVIPSLHFTRRIHNKLHCTGDTIMTEMKIYHYGYALEDKEYMKLKKDRTTKLLLRQFEETPDDPEVPYYLGIQYLRFEEWDKAIKYQKIAIDLFKKHDPDSQLTLLAHHVIACANYHQQTHAKTFDFTEAIDYSKKALEIYPDYADSNSILSSIYFALKDYENCEKHAERFLAACEMLKKDRSKSLVIPMNTLNNEWLIYLQLSINYFEKADSHKAIYFLAKSEDLLPLDQKYKPSFGVFKYLLLRGDAVSLKRAEAIYQEGFRADTRPLEGKQ